MFEQFLAPFRRQPFRIIDPLRNPLGIEHHRGCHHGTGQMPRFINARSRRKLGGATAITPFGDLPGSSFGFSRLMAGIVQKPASPRNRELRPIPVIQWSQSCQSVASIE